jgi:hypothetical protein
MAEKASPSTEPRSGASKLRDLITRGDYTSDPLGRATFVLLRTIDPFLQYSILAHGLGTGLLHRVGLRTLPAGIPAHTGIPVIDALGLSPYRLILLGMTIACAVKQNVRSASWWNPKAPPPILAVQEPTLTLHFLYLRYGQ